MDKNLHIISSVVIRDGNAIVDEKPVFVSKETIKPFLSALYRDLKIDYSKFFKMDNLSKLGFLAVELLNIKIDETNHKQTGLFLWNGVSSLDTDVNYQTTIQPDNYFPSPAVFVYTLPNIVLGEICIRHKIYGENTFFVVEQFDKKEMFKFIDLVFEQSNLQQVVVGWLNCYKENYEAVFFLVSKNGN